MTFAKVKVAEIQGSACRSNWRADIGMGIQLWSTVRRTVDWEGFKPNPRDNIAIMYGTLKP